MNWRTRAAVHVITGASVIAVQVACTLRDRSRWPFCSYNMFNRALPGRMRNQMRIQLWDDAGGRTGMLPVWGTLPMEHFRVSSTFLTLFVAGQDERARREFARLMLDRLNRSPWGAFDQRKAALRPQRGRRFTGFSLFRVAIDLSTYDGDLDGPYDETELLYSYRVPAPEAVDVV